MADNTFALQVFCTPHNLVRSNYFSDTYRATFALDGIEKAWDITHISLPMEAEKERALQARFEISDADLFSFYKRFAKCVQNDLAVVRYVGNLPETDETGEDGKPRIDPAKAVKNSVALYKYRKIIPKPDKRGSDVYLVTEPLEPFVGSEFCNGHAITMNNLLSFAARAAQLINGFSVFGFHLGAIDLDTVFLQTLNGKKFFTFGSFLYAGFEPNAAPDNRKDQPWPDIVGLQTVPANADQRVVNGEAPTLVTDMHALVALLWAILSGRHYRDAPDYSEAPKYAPDELVEILVAARDSDDPAMLKTTTKRFHTLMRRIKRQELPDTVIQMEAPPDYRAVHPEEELDPPQAGQAGQAAAKAEEESPEPGPEQNVQQESPPAAEAVPEVLAVEVIAVEVSGMESAREQPKAEDRRGEERKVNPDPEEAGEPQHPGRRPAAEAQDDVEGQDISGAVLDKKAADGPPDAPKEDVQPETPPAVVTHPEPEEIPAEAHEGGERQQAAPDKDPPPVSDGPPKGQVGPVLRVEAPESQVPEHPGPGVMPIDPPGEVRPPSDTTAASPAADTEPDAEEQPLESPEQPAYTPRPARPAAEAQAPSARTARRKKARSAPKKQAQPPQRTAQPTPKPVRKVVRRTTTYQAPQKGSRVGTVLPVLILLLLGLFFGLCALQYLGYDVPYNIPLIDDLSGSSFTVTPEHITLEVGEETVLSSSEGCTLSSSDHDVAVVSDTGYVKAVGAGTCTITARASSSSAVVKISVTVIDRSE